MILYITGLIIFLAGGIFSIFFNEKTKGFIFLAFSLISQFLILPQIFSALSSPGIELSIKLSEPIGISYLRLDPLSAVFALIISIGSLLAAVYSIGYMKMYQGSKSGLSNYYFFLGLLASSMLLVVVVQNSILFLIVWELMSLSSFFLVIFENRNQEVLKAGTYYLTAMQIGAAFLIAAFSWAASISGSLDFKSFISVFNDLGSSAILLFILFFIGFGMKAGFLPMHTWLPRAHPAAPTGVSALMSGVMIKTGIYGILRIILSMGIPDLKLAYAVFIISLFTGIFGVINAIAQHDIKKLLAYSSIENIGIIGMGIGLGMLGLAYNNSLIAALGFLGALLHTINHFTFKSVLFYGSGIIYKQTHTRTVDKLGGLGKYLPLTSIMFLTASLAITGLPVFNGFISEFAIYLGMTKNFSAGVLNLDIISILGVSGLAFIGSMVFICFTKVYGICFLGIPRSEYKSEPNEKEISLLLPMGLLTIAIFLIGIFPVFFVNLLVDAVNQFVPGNPLIIPRDIISIFTKISVSLSGFILVSIFFYSLRKWLLHNKVVRTFKTWDCGYQAESSRLQYTGSSFVHQFLQLVSGLVPQKLRVQSEQVLFPKEISLESNSQDPAERFLVQPSIRFINKFMNLFSWIQSGRMQQYIVYGLIFLILLLIWILGVE